MLRKLYFANLWLCALVLLAVMVMFGAFNDSFLAGLALPTALPLLASQGDPLSLWLLSPIYLLPILFLALRAAGTTSGARPPSARRQPASLQAPDLEGENGGRGKD